MNRKLKLDTSSASHSPLRRRVTMGAIAAVGAATIALAGVVNATPANISGIILLVGADESQRVVNWYASANTQQVVQVARMSELLDGAFPNGATTYSAVVAANWKRTLRTPTASVATAPGPPRTRSRPASSTAISTSCSSAIRRSARRATCPRTRRAGRKP